MRTANRWVTVTRDCRLIAIGTNRFRGQSAANQMGPTGRTLLMPAIREAAAGQKVDRRVANRRVVAFPVIGPDGTPHGACGVLLEAGAPLPEPPQVTTWTVESDMVHVRLPAGDGAAIGLDETPDGRFRVAEVLSNLPTSGTHVVSLIGVQGQFGPGVGHVFHDWQTVDPDGIRRTTRNYMERQPSGEVRGLSIVSDDPQQVTDPYTAVPAVVEMVPILLIAFLETPKGPSAIYTNHPGRRQPFAVTDVVCEQDASALTDLIASAVPENSTEGISLRMSPAWGSARVVAKAQRYAEIDGLRNAAVLVTLWSPDTPSLQMTAGPQGH